MRGFNLLLFWGCCVMHSWERHTRPTLKPNTKGNNCRDSTLCPAYATCTNTVDSYYCACKQGFLSSNGQNHFKGPGVQCKDIDECSQSPQPCGPNSSCKNLSGRYKCSCLDGFSSPTGNNWVPGKPGNFSCTDINECLTSTVCPEHSDCVNSMGSYNCSCQVGFISRNSTCEDIDECSQSPQPCGPNSSCENLSGRYKCSCLDGFSSPTGNDWIPGKPGNFSCTDINECLTSTVCPEHSDCVNSMGSYNCSCQVGFISRNSTCEDIDECSQSPQPCGPNSSCENLSGRYKCSCLDGFSSPTGNDWIPGKPGNFSCTDINECLTSTVCPEHSDCVNSMGSYNCSCQVGFISRNSTCEDIDECSQSPQPCGPNSSCENLSGRYKCSCLDGFSSPTGNDWIPGKPGNFSCTDINECLTSTVCPEHSDCVNSMGSYNCSCQVGFISRNSTCEDIDECSQSPQPCGPNSSCENLSGRYKCSCLDGFSSPTGNDWIPGKPGNFSCTDINECLTSTVCPEHSDCVNSMGSYNCSCQVGFISRNSTCEDVDECADPRACPEHATCNNTVGNYSCFCNPGFESSSGHLSFQGLKASCEDIDECTEMCPINSTCTNTPGSYFCTCHPGFAPSNGQLNFTDQEVECRDIDECRQDPSTCGPNSICTNAVGSYSCGCIAGFRPNPEGSQKDGNFSCQRVLFKCKEDVIPDNKQIQQCQEGATVKPVYVSFCAQTNNIFSILDKVCENKTTVVSLKNTTESFVPVLKQISTWTKFTKEETSSLATVFLESVESMTLASFWKPSANVTPAVQTKYLDIESKVINKECSEENVTLNLVAKGDKMKIGCSTIEESESTGTTGVAFVSFVGMESVLNERFFQDHQAPLTTSEIKLKMNSRVVGGIMTGEKKDGFSDPVIYTLENIQPKQKFERPICVSWSSDMKGGRWTSFGCVILEASETYTTCSCNQMANLAVIMASGELTMDFSLYVISHVGIIISVVCLVLAIATFLLCRSIRNHNTYLHLHLCVCLLLAKTLFLAGIHKTDYKMGCAIIAGFLHYLFLACFFWMLVEAVILFLMVRNLKVVNYFSSRNIKMLHICAFGYGLPMLVVVISASVRPQGYGMHNRCWLNTETGFIWSFLGPVCTVIVVNSILLTWTLWILRQRLSSVNAEVSTLKDTRLLTFKAFAQLFILGCSWVLGIFQIGPVAGVMAYLFTIINSLQGAFIFLIHCLLNRQVREEYKRWITGKTKPSSQSQTSRILLSSMPSASKTG
ncbi:adhesion G protein-coupled receptor E1 [Pongo pygmaeus]|uniref:adhesion G protein-coupled receptor E1 n=1 Tax=Pongo pygmaeus TaxID=9600 RepID=UPI00300CDE0D